LVTRVQVPKALLLDENLLSSTKVVWMVLALRGSTGSLPSQRRLADECSLATSTVQFGLTRLQTTGWLARQESGQWKVIRPRTHGNQKYAYVPALVLHDRRLTTQAKVLYGSLQLIPEFSGAKGRFKYRDLIQLTGRSRETLRRALRLLVETGWLVIERRKGATHEFTLRKPHRRQYQEVEVARRRLNRALYLGEALMRELLNLVVDSDEYEDNASPGYLINYFTGERMEFDRYYAPNVAIEYNGPQHYVTTELYDDEEELVKQVGRDAMKRKICELRGIPLIVIHPEDLTVEGIQKKVAGLLPLRDLTNHQPLVAFLERRARAYIRKVRAARPASNRAAGHAASDETGGTSSYSS